MLQDPTAQLGKMYIEEFLCSRGYTWENVCQLPKEEARKLMIEASTYAAVKLAEVYARAHTVEELHNIARSE